MSDEQSDSRPARAVRFFRTAINSWLDVGIADDPFDLHDYTPKERMEALITAVLKFVKIVRIDLEPNDNAQLIFETLNGRGERLTDADLIRNALFRQADYEQADTDALYNRYWKPFDGERWTARVTHGRHQKDRLSLFLTQWLSLKEMGEVPPSVLFRRFKEYVQRSAVPAETLAKDLAELGEVFDSFDRFPVNSREWWFFRRLGEMDLTTVQTVTLYLFSLPESSLSVERRHRALDAIESFLVRRLVTRSTTRSYGAVFVDVLKEAAAGDPATADERVIELLMSKTSETEGWPTDDAVRSAVLNTNIYKLKQSRLKMILEGIDVHRSQSGNTETISLGHSLWIEHLMPQSWRTEPGWAQPDVASAHEGLHDRCRLGLRDELRRARRNCHLQDWRCTGAACNVGSQGMDAQRPKADVVECCLSHRSDRGRYRYRRGDARRTAPPRRHRRNRLGNRSRRVARTFRSTRPALASPRQAPDQRVVRPSTVVAPQCDRVVTVDNNPIPTR